MSVVSDLLSSPLCALAFCWRLERRDGVTIGLTSHDQMLEVHGLRYAPTPGIVPSAILRGSDVTDDLADIKGALSSAAIGEADLDAGRWDGAFLLLHLTEWTEPGGLWLEIARGTLGGIERTGGSYSVSLRSAVATMLSMPAAATTSSTCRARLGDPACRVDLRRHQLIAPIIDMEGDAVTFAALADQVYPFGELRWLEGPNAGFVQAIVDQDADTVFLAELPPYAPVVGDRALLTKGCDKRLATCSARFANVANFRGEPHLPGMDLLTRYPGS